MIVRRSPRIPVLGDAVLSRADHARDSDSATDGDGHDAPLGK